MADYLRHRPFMVVTHIQRPAKGVNTSKAGWSNADTEWDVSENMVIVDRVKTNQMNMASVILDLLEGTVVKNRFGDRNTEVFKAYFGRYQQEIIEALKTWGLKDPANRARLEQASADKAAKEGTDEQADSN